MSWAFQPLLTAAPLLVTPDTTAPVLSSPTSTGVTTDEGNGTLYAYASANATETAATIKSSGHANSVTASGVQTPTFNSRTAGTYYNHYVQDDAASNESNVVHSSSYSYAPPSNGSRFASAGAGSGSKLYRTTGLPNAATGVLLSAWVKIADWTTSPPYDRHNDYTFWIDATNWQVVCINGNLFGTSSTDNAVYNANSGFKADATGFGDTTAYIQQFMPEVQNLDYVWVCWQVIAPPNSDVTLRQWLRFGLEMPLIFREEIMTLSAIRTATGNPTWSAGALTQITIGDNHDGDVGVFQDIMRVRWEQYGSLPSDDKLSAIAALDAADTTAWGDYLLEYSTRTVDRSGNSRTLTESGTITEGGAINNIASDPYVVQARPKTSGSTNALAETFAATPTVGNTVLIRGTARSAGTITASDNKGNIYTVYANAPASGHKSFVIVAPITSSSATFTVTVSGLGTVSTQYQLEELQGLYTVDWTALPATQSAGLTVNAPSANTAEALVFGVCCPVTAGVTVYNPGGGYKSITGQDGDNGILLAKLSASGVTESITYPAPSSGNISGILVGLVRTSGGISVSIAETVTSLDTQSSNITAPVTRVETVTALDTESTALAAPVARVETVAALDTLSATIVASVTRVETATALDAPSATATTSVASIETATALDSLSTAMTASVEIVESLSGAESSSSNLTVSQTVSEAGSIVDTISATVAAALAIVENASAVETITLSMSAPLTVAETVTALEVLSANLQANLSISENASVVDSTSTVLEVFVTIAETLTALDSSNQTTGGISFNVTLDEVVSAIESVSQTPTFTLLIAEIGESLDTISMGLIAPVSVNETLTAQETTGTGTIFGLAITETGAALDTLATTLTAALNLSESLTSLEVPSSGLTAPVTVLETATALDTSGTSPIYQVVVSEQVTAIDAQTPQLSAALSVLESLSAAELAALIATKPTAIGEVASVFDAVSESLALPKTVAESEALLDSQSNNTFFSVLVVENGSASDSVDNFTLMGVSVIEGLIIIDSVSIIPDRDALMRPLAGVIQLRPNGTVRLVRPITGKQTRPLE